MKMNQLQNWAFHSSIEDGLPRLIVDDEIFLLRYLSLLRRVPHDSRKQGLPASTAAVHDEIGEGPGEQNLSLRTHDRIKIKTMHSWEIGKKP